MTEIRKMTAFFRQIEQQQQLRRHKYNRLKKMKISRLQMHQVAMATAAATIIK